MGDFMDKAMGFATEALDKTGEMVELGKFKAKIAAKNSEIEKMQKSMGQYFYELYKEQEDPEEMDPEILDMCRQIDATYDEIAILEEKMEKVKQEKE